MEKLITVDNIRFKDRSLVPIWEKVRSGERIGMKDGARLFETEDFAAVGRMADHVKSNRSGDKVFFVINRHINPTNVCALSCSFCDFAKKKGDPDAYEMSNEEILDLIDDETTEVHIVGGHHPDWPFERYEGIVKAIHERFPEKQIKAFTASEIDYFSRRWKVPPEEALARFKAAGLRSMPGGGAEVFSDRVQEQLRFSGKAGAERWLEIHRIAHRMGIRSNATILYGHIETYDERARHLMMLRELQDETEGFLAFIPLEYQVGDTRVVTRHATPFDDLKMIAAARLMLDNFPHIKAYWVMIHEETAAVALNFGADDMDGTIGRERIAHAAKAKSPAGMARDRIVRLIRDAGRTPVERDALYNELRVYN
ncbi:MAG: aminofutalosine synthase MqnE [Candidatus Latescibacteria bacterium]|nr:aminofutalosine synthase MqnE [Candidatus Latescibacterota bacterium]NIM22689.1 aminofutalosine synthase MqnE [Candidatus Latescibacterota bacterium]NIM64978.1 aminofutalosine synthase MqnE [Candidatus Latescibacterota bacterium]NIO01493.1 aminofutalosine synthase MqnE [Candidatus Latescibacterota bacterium]NIO28003.1 aminofutalosine synthase MqnE [Candidatus Latescibacterota bacterium]